MSTPDSQRNRFAQVQSLFESALEVPPAERPSFLEKACNGDRELISEVESLIRHFESEDKFLSTPAVMEALAQIDAGTSAQPGLRFGRFEIVSKLGAGGMGEVYRAVDTQLGRAVALKVLPHAVLEHPEALSRFKREAKALSRLNHPNIATVYEVGDEGGRPFLVMELIEGSTLREMILQGGIKPAEAARIAKQIATALDVAHRDGIIHRDVKPENVILRPDGIAKLVDFGLAKWNAPQDEQTLRTVAGARMGTVQYMSPEQLRGEEAGEATDLWSLGVVLFEMLSGKRPFEGETPNHVAVNILEKDPPRLKFEHGTADGAAAALFAQTLVKDPTRRLSSAKELVGKLERLETALGDTAKPRTVASGSRTRNVAVASALGVAMTAGLWWSTREPAIEYQFENSRMSKLTSSGRVVVAGISDDAETLAYCESDGASFSLAVKSLATGDVRQLLSPVLSKYWGITVARASRDVYFVREDDPKKKTLYRVPAAGGAPVKVIEDVDSAVTFSPDGGHLAFIRNTTARRENALLVARADGHELRTVAIRREPESFTESGCAWSRDERTILCPVLQRDAGGAIRTKLVQYRADGTAAHELATTWRTAARPVWTSTSTAVVPAVDLDSVTSRLIWVNVATGATRTVLADLNTYESLSSSSSPLAVTAVQTESRSGIWVGPIDKLQRTTDDRSQYRFVAWSPTGKLIAQANDEGGSTLVELNADGSGRRRLTTPDAIAWRPAVAPDGSVVFNSNRTGAWNIWKLPASGGVAVQLTFGTNIDSSPQVTPDGQWIVYVSRASGKTTLWRIPVGGGTPVQLTTERSDHPVISPDGRWIACDYLDAASGSEGHVAILRIDGGAPAHRIQGIPSEALFRWAPGGTALTFVETVNGVSNLWNVPVAGGSRSRLTTFTSDQILSFDWSRDGKQIAVVRGSTTRDVVMIRPAAGR